MKRVAHATTPSSPDPASEPALPYLSLFLNAPTPTWVQDFSETRQLFDQLRNSGTTDFKAYFEANPAEVRRAVDALRILEINRAGLALFKAADVTELARRVTTCFLDETWASFRQALIAMAQGALRFECVTPWRDLKGGRLSTLMTVAVIPESARSLACVLVSFTDLAAQKQLTSALRESEKRFRTLLRDIPAVSVQGYNAEGNVVFWNEASTKLYGYTAEEALGRHLTDLIIPPAIRDDVRAAIDYMVKTLKPIPAGPLDLMRKDGSLVPVFSSHAVMYVPDHGFELYCLDVDLSELKRTEAELAQQKEMALKLQQHLQQAAKMDAIGRLAGGVAHDFNNLLQAILGFTEILLEQSPSHGAQHETLTQIRRAGSRAADLTRQLLAFSRKQMIEPRVIDLNANVTGAHDMLQRLLGEDIRLQTITDPQLLPVKADPGQIDQVILNLSVNARDAMPAGGRLTIRTSNVTFGPQDIEAIPESHPGTFACLSISDTGTGMDSATLGHLFEPFFTTKEVGKGSGLGLAVIYGILKQNNGWIHVYSRMGLGSTFNLYFPVHSGVAPRSQELASAAEPSAHPPRGNGECLLLVEDDPAVRSFAVTALQSHGYRVLPGESTQEALALFEANRDRITLLFSDVVLPGQNGVDLAEHLLALKPELPVLLSSGYADERARWQTIEARGFRFLQKPYPVAKLLGAIADLLNQRSSP